MSPSAILVSVKARHERLRALKRCINGPLVGYVSKRTGRVHGEVYKGGRCRLCWERKLDCDRGEVVPRIAMLDDFNDCCQASGFHRDDCKEAA